MSRSDFVPVVVGDGWCWCCRKEMRFIHATRRESNVRKHVPHPSSVRQPPTTLPANLGCAESPFLSSSSFSFLEVRTIPYTTGKKPRTNTETRKVQQPWSKKSTSPTTRYIPKNYHMRRDPAIYPTIHSLTCPSNRCTNSAKMPLPASSPTSHQPS